MSGSPYSDSFFAKSRRQMVANHLAARDITDRRVLAAMRHVPRHRFVSPLEYDEAYADYPLRIACGQTISQPYIVALMTQLLQLKRGMRVLEIGTGSGYQTAVLCRMGAKVYTIERHEALTASAEMRLSELGYGGQVEFFVDDGSLGCSEEAPFDRIIVTAAAPKMPDALLKQLADGGRMVVPVGVRRQQLYVVTRTGSKFTREAVADVVFVPLIGKDGTGK